LIAAGRPDRHHQPAAVAQLLEQGLRDVIGCGCDDDGVERRFFGPAEKTPREKTFVSLRLGVT
jgi:hypothetical protein